MRLVCGPAGTEVDILVTTAITILPLELVRYGGRYVDQVVPKLAI